jgi:hypothetical protein
MNSFAKKMIDPLSSTAREIESMHQRPKEQTRNQFSELRNRNDDEHIMPTNWRQSRSRGWCFTLAHPSAEEIAQIRQKIEEEARLIKKCIVGREFGKDGEFEHLQGYINFKEAVSGWCLQRRYNSRAHWEAARGSPLQNFKYCSKENKVLISHGFEKEEQQNEKKRHKTSTGTR